MRWLESLRHRKKQNIIVHAYRNAVEALEPRRLLNATVTSSINAVTSAPGTTSAPIDLTQHFDDPLVPGTLVEITTPEGTIPVALSDPTTPKTVANFLSYINNGEYQNTIIHRLATGFVIQGGGYTPDGNHIAQQAPVASEAGASNTTGTIAMALSTGPDSGTSEWFINLADNSSSLDGTTNGGPFTVFGNVVYGGMTVVNQIAALPVIDASSTNAAWNTLPVINASGGATASNEVGTQYSIVSPLTFTATSDNPSLVTPNITGSNLTLTFGSGSGDTQVHVTATDIGGNTTTTTFAVGVGVQSVTVGTKGVQVVRFHDSGGTQGEISLAGGKGTATVTLIGTNLIQLPGKNQVVQVTGSVASASITTTGTTPTSVLTIVGHGGNGIVHLTGITTDAQILRLNAPRAALNGSITASGSIGEIDLGSAANGTITIGAGTGTVLNIKSMSNMNVTSFVAVNRMRVDSWTGVANFNGIAINDVKIKQSFDGNLTANKIADFQAGSLIGGTWVVGGDVHSIKAQSIANWTANLASLGKLLVAGTVGASTINSSSNITSVKAAALTSTNVYAGATNLTSGLASSTTDFTANAKIESLSVKRFVNSDVVAQRITTLALGAVQVANSGTSFGTSTQRIKDLTLSSGGKKIHLRNVTSTAKVTAALTGQGITPQDFVVKII